MNWDDLRHFGTLAKAGSLSAAARLLGVEHATVARRIAALEADLGLTLVDRRGRRWSLTDDGRHMAAIAERMEKEAASVRRAAEGARLTLTGTVTISAPPALAAIRLAGPLTALQARHPGLMIRLIGEARSASLTHSEADLAIRLSRPDDPDLTRVKLGMMAFHLYASPAYLAAHPEPTWRFIGNEGPMAGAPQQEALQAYAAGRPLALTASSVEIQHRAALAGAGIAALPDFIAADDPGLVRLMPDKPLVLRDIYLVVHSDLKRAAPVKAVMAQLKTAFPSRATLQANGL
ncbi:LysR family transcriptional regulator [Xaviernesmea oryzae]|uniref:LysR family transcriptional regulator n=1 Tax=Xaviernesmea oryzae TaxID=464029 RepID=A0A1Q9ATC3_9HYPH|nr:LysR family transcriptional regulator [Xaviernesmea oryzae]OLP58692.1 LysR family transcriptional regulator [Xaviernesmea oryzae]SEK68327.1 transcriptional regulator, LysR family [Xaviernesmea oryzae]